MEAADMWAPTFVLHISEGHGAEGGEGRLVGRTGAAGKALKWAIKGVMPLALCALVSRNSRDRKLLLAAWLAGAASGISLPCASFLLGVLASL